MKNADNDLDGQTKVFRATKLFYVADMHELVNPNDEARRIISNSKGKTLADSELITIYNNSEDPLVIALANASTHKSDLRLYNIPVNRQDILVMSLGDLVLNRVDTGEGTEKSIVGKLARKARELGVPQHEYICNNLEHDKQKIQEFIHRNNFWTRLRFENVEKIINESEYLKFVHINGNADVLSSMVGQAVLPNEKSPMQIYNESGAIEAYFEKLPGIIPMATNYCDSCEYHHGPVAIAVPYSIDFDASTKHLEILKSGMGKMTKGSIIHGSESEDIMEVSNFCMLTHEPLDYGPFNKKEKIEGIRTYEKAMNLWPISYIVHGHTHADQITRYKFQGKNVFQIPPKELIGSTELVN